MVCERTFKPETDYEVNNSITLEEIIYAYKSNVSITGRVLNYGKAPMEVSVDLGNGIIGTLPFDEFTIENVNSRSEILERIIPQSKIRVKVKDIVGDRIVLSRKANMLEAWEALLSKPISCIYNAVVLGSYNYGVFFDIGEGLVALCHVNEVSTTRINPNFWFRHGEHIKVKIIEVNEDVYHIRCSIKKLFYFEETLDNVHENQIIPVKLAYPIYDRKNNLSGFFVEITPAVTGIADVPQKETCGSYNMGQVVNAFVKKLDKEKKRIKLNII